MVNALQGTQYFWLLLLAVAVSRWRPQFFKEELARVTVVQKVAGICSGRSWFIIDGMTKRRGGRRSTRVKAKRPKAWWKRVIAGLVVAATGIFLIGLWLAWPVSFPPAQLHGVTFSPAACERDWTGLARNV